MAGLLRVLLDALGALTAVVPASVGVVWTSDKVSTVFRNKKYLVEQIDALREACRGKDSMIQTLESEKRALEAHVADLSKRLTPYRGPTE